jgi:RHS repeat-associated protein
VTELDLGAGPHRDGNARVASSGQTTTFGYDAAGNLTTVTLPSGNGHVAARSFDRAGRLSTVENAKSGTILSKFAWTLDPAGNPTKPQTTRGGSDTYDAYEYDSRNRLTGSCYGVPSSATNCTGASNAITYAYDKVANRTQEVRTGNVGNTGTTDYTYNDADQLTSSTKGGVTTAFSYDANGNQTAAGARTFTYDLGNRLISTTGGGTTTTYTYDGNDRRVGSTTSGGADLRYIWDPLAESGMPEVALEREPTGGLVRRYLGGPLGAVSFTNASATFYYHRDHLGSITDVSDANGNAQWRYDYDAYGNARTATNVSGTAPANQLRFNGQYLDIETSQYHLRARQYDPAVGRFGALDPVENPLDEAYVGPYAYVSGRPTVFEDPLGLCRKNPLSQDFWTRGNCVSDGASTIGHGFQKTVEDATKDYEDCGGGWQCAYHSLNENFNPMYQVLISSDKCGASGFSRSECLAIARDLVIAVAEVAGGGVAGRCATQALRKALARLGEKWGSRLGRLLADERGGTRGGPGSLRAAAKDFQAAERSPIKYATEPNKLHHIFAAQHKLQPLVQQFGSREAV